MQQPVLSRGTRIAEGAPHTPTVSARERGKGMGWPPNFYSRDTGRIWRVAEGPEYSVRERLAVLLGLAAIGWISHVYPKLEELPCRCKSRAGATAWG